MHSIVAINRAFVTFLFGLGGGLRDAMQCVYKDKCNSLNNAWTYASLENENGTGDLHWMCHCIMTKTEQVTCHKIFNLKSRWKLNASWTDDGLKDAYIEWFIAKWKLNRWHVIKDLTSHQCENLGIVEQVMCWTTLTVPRICCTLLQPWHILASLGKHLTPAAPYY